MADDTSVRIACCCGETVYATASRITRCRKCGTGWKLVVEARAFARDKEGWEPADTHCEGCGRALLYDQVAQHHEDADLCRKCALPEEASRG